MAHDSQLTIQCGLIIVWRRISLSRSDLKRVYTHLSPEYMSANGNTEKAPDTHVDTAEGSHGLYGNGDDDTFPVLFPCFFERGNSMGFLEQDLLLHEIKLYYLLSLSKRGMKSAPYQLKCTSHLRLQDRLVFGRTLS